MGRICGPFLVFFGLVLSGAVTHAIKLPSRVQNPPHVGGLHWQPRESLIFVDRQLGNGSYGCVVEALYSGSVAEPGYAAMRPVFGRCLGGKPSLST
eukprot:scaffold447_cov307-Pinguiococcus_pyrenoidosus.AAC.78